MLLGDYIEYFYKTYRRMRHQETTQAVPLNYIFTHVKPSPLGKMDIADVRAKDIQAFLSELSLRGNKSIHSQNRGTGLSNWTVQKIRALIAAALAQAVKEKIIACNYAADTPSIPTPQSSAAAFSPEQQKKFLQHTKNHRYHLAYLLLFYTGCRRSEILGLAWENISWRDNYIFISQTLVSCKNGCLLKKRTKTAASVRSIPITKEIKFMLREWQHKQRSEKAKSKDYDNKYNLIFTTKNGAPVNPAGFSKAFKEKCRKLGFADNLRLHSTRHTFATNMLQLNVPIPDIQALGGWSSPDTLMKIYAHTVQKSHRKAIQKLYKSFN